MRDIINIARSAAIGPIRLGQTFTETVRTLGNPSHLNFRYDDMFDGTMLYGPLEIFFRIQGDNVSSYLVQLHLFRASAARQLRINREISFRRPEKPELSYPRVAHAMNDAGMEFETNSPAKIAAGMHPLMQFDEKVRFYFLPFGRGGNLQMGYIEFGDYRSGPDE